MPGASSLLSLSVFAVSSLLFYNGILLFVNFMTNGSLDMKFFFSNPLLLLLSIPIFIGIWAVVDSLLRAARKKGTKVILSIFSILIIIPAAFSASLNYGILDSLTLLNDSVIDLSSCTAMLHLRNNGLTEMQVLSVEIGKLLCNVSSYPWLGIIKPGESEILHIYYAYRQFVWGLDRFSQYPSGPQYDSNLEISPTTFEEGKIPVVIHTDGVLSYRFEVEAKFSNPEEICGFQVEIFNLHNESDVSQNCYLPDMTFTFNMSQQSIALIHSLEIGNLTLQLIPPPIVCEPEPYNYFAISLSSSYGVWVNAFPSESTRVAIANQALDVPIFKLGETYNLTVRTMANNNYTTQIKMTN